MSVTSQDEFIEDVNHALSMSYEHPWLKINRIIEQKNELKIYEKTDLKARETKNMKISCFIK
jgi:hypothetical protein